MASPGDERFGVLVSAAVLGGCGVGEEFLVGARTAAQEMVERVGEQHDEQQAAEGQQPEVAVLDVGVFVGEQGAELARGADILVCRWRIFLSGHGRQECLPHGGGREQDGWAAEAHRGGGGEEFVNE